MAGSTRGSATVRESGSRAAAPDWAVHADRVGTGSVAGDDAPVVLECTTCAIRGVGCSDCVVALLLGPPDAVVVDVGQVRALAVLAGSGLVPPLRHTRVERGA